MVELTVSGTLELDQFWPDGESDADTTKVLVTPNGFSIRPLPGGVARDTHVFDGAKVKGSGGTKPVLNNAGKLTVRLQGIDAPELHYRAAPLKGGSVTPEVRARYNGLNTQFRQYLAETATVALATHLKTAGLPALPCTAVTIVDEPNDVFDTYGRFVGDIHVTVGGVPTVINRWLVEKGWAYPAFYNSMKPDEVTSLRDAGNTARQTHALIWKHLTGKIGTLDMALVFRGKGAPPQPAADIGKVIMPKLYRRQVGWTIAKKAAVPNTPTTFRKMLEKNATKDAFFLTDDFLANSTLSATIRTFPEFLDANGKFTLKPDELVFREASSTLIGADGEEVEAWD